MASTAASTAATAGPSQDAIASLITQVSPTGQPARAPNRPVRPRQGTKRTASAKAPVAATTVNGNSNAASTAAEASGSTNTSDNTQIPSSSRLGAPTGGDDVHPNEGAMATAAAPTARSDTARQPPSNGEASVHSAEAQQQQQHQLHHGREATTGEDATIATNDTKGSLASTSESAVKAGAETTQSSAVSPALKNKGHTSTSAVSDSPASSSSKHASASGQIQQKKKKRKSFWANLFTCFSADTHLDEDSDTSMSERKAGTANALRVTPVTAQTNNTKNITKNVMKTTNNSTTIINNTYNTSQMTPAQDSAAIRGSSGGNDRTGSGAGGYGGAATVAGATVTATTLAAAAAMAERNARAREHDDGGAGSGSSQLPNNPTSQSIPPSPKPDLSPEVVAANNPLGQTLPLEETEGVLSGAVQAPGSEGLTPKKSTRRKSSGEASSQLMSNTPNRSGDATAADLLGDESQASGGEEALEESEEDYMDEDERIIAAGGAGIPVDEYGNPRPLLRELTPSDSGRKCLVLDLDETLLHSSFKLVHSPDFVVPVEIESQVHNVYVLKRPGVDAFMKRMGEIYEVVVFTASLSKYADPVLDCLDIHKVVKHRLFRESCYNHKGNYVKDLSQLGRPIGETIIIDNSPASYIFHPNNAVPVSSWFNDPHDTELTDLQHFLTDLAQVPDVRGVLDGGLFPPSEL